MSDDRRWDETRRLRRDDAPGDAEDTRRLDAIGDSTYPDPYGDDDTATGYADPAAGYTEPATDPPSDEPAPDAQRNGLPGAVLVLLGLGLGFVAALVTVALLGTDIEDTDMVVARDARIAELEQELQQSEQAREDLEATLEQRDEHIADLQAGLEDAEGDLAQRQQQLDDRQQSLDQRERELDEREETLDQRERGMAERDQEANGDQPDDGSPGDIDLPDLDGDEAEAFIDRIIEGIRDMFR